MKILLSAFACQPGLGSEEGVGWGTAWTLARTHRVHVLTTPRHRESIERFLALNPCPQLTFSYFDCSRGITRWVVTSALWQVYYHIWQCQIGTWAKDIAHEFEPDVVHHVTYGRYWTPCSLWKLGRPFIWGPLGGGDACPPAFRSCLGFRDRLEARARDLAQRLATADPMLRATAAHATIAIGSTPATEARLRALGCSRVVPLLQMALDAQLLRPTTTTPEPGLFCSVGRLLGWKGHALTLKAFARMARRDTRLVIIGDGPARRRLGALAAKLNISARVEFLGSLSRDGTLDWIRRSTALVHSSFHDQAPTVVFEAMAAGTPVIALALGGTVRQITNETGILVPARSPDQAADDLAAAMSRLLDQPELRARLAAAGPVHVQQQFTWQHKVEQFTALYRAAMGSSPQVRNDAANMPAPASPRAIATPLAEEHAATSGPAPA